MHYACPVKFCVTIVSNFPWVLRYSQEKFKQCLWKIIFVDYWGALLNIPQIVEMANEPGAQIHSPKNARRRIRVPSSEALWPKMKTEHRKPR